MMANCYASTEHLQEHRRVRTPPHTATARIKLRKSILFEHEIGQWAAMDLPYIHDTSQPWHQATTAHAQEGINWLTKTLKQRPGEHPS
jgi:hypothetical protein